MVFWAIAITGFALMILERIFPDNKLEQVPGWWMRVIIINTLQMGVVVLAGTLLNPWLLNHSLFNLRDYFNAPINGFIGYFAVTFVFYWWHRWRHTVNFLWLTFHQVHHSASRIETITSFYKHPLEIMLNSVIIGTTIYILLGVDAEAGGWCTLYSALGEYIYHVNIKTPHWMGYIFQRPEMHRIHHQRGRHFNNFSDFPFWDMLFGTYENPKEFAGPCGFKLEREQSLWKMLTFRNVNNPYKKNK